MYKSLKEMPIWKSVIEMLFEVYRLSTLQI